MRSRISLLATLPLVLAGAAACAPESTEAPLSLESALALESTAEVGPSTVSLHVDNELFDIAADVRIPVHDVDFAAVLDDNGFAFDRLVFDLGAIDISAEGMPPSGLRLRQVALTMLAPTADPYALGNMYVRSADRVEVAARLPFEIRWKLELEDGELFDLGPGVMSPLGAVVRVTYDGAQAKLKIVATCAESCWSLPGLLSFSHGAITLEAPLLLTPLP